MAYDDPSTNTKWASFCLQSTQCIYYIYLFRVWLLWLLTHYSEIASVAVLAEAGARAHHALLHRLCQRHHLARQPLLVYNQISGGVN